jgi:hypothetical protein
VGERNLTSYLLSVSEGICFFIFDLIQIFWDRCSFFFESVHISLHHLVEIIAESFFASCGSIAFVFNVESADSAVRVALRCRLDILNCVKCH